MLAHHAQERLAVLLVAFERAAVVTRHARRLGIGLAGHHGRDRRGHVPAAVAVVRQATRHQQRAEVRIAEPERPIGEAVALDRLGRVARVVDDDLLRGDQHAAGGAEAVDVELAPLVDELHQVDRRQVARRVVQEHVLRARVARVDAGRVRAGVPVVDGRVVLHARVAADVRRFGDLVHQVARLVGRHRRPVADRVRRPVLVVEHRAHEVVGDADAVVAVLEEHRGIRRARERAVVAGVDQRPGLLLFLDLAVDELGDVRVIGVEDDHLRRAARLAARLDDARKRVEALHERHRPGGRAAAREQFLRRADRRQVGARARAVLEQHALGLGEGEDRLHRVLHGVDEARRALRVGFDAAVEPDGAVEGGLLEDEQVLQIVVEGLQVVLAREVLLRARPAGDGIHHAPDQLPHGALALRRADGAAEVLGDDDVGRLLRPRLRHLDVALLEHDVALLVADDRRAGFPLHGVERVDPVAREEPGELQARYRHGISGASRLAEDALDRLCRLHSLPPHAGTNPPPGRRTTMSMSNPLARVTEGCSHGRRCRANPARRGVPAARLGAQPSTVWEA